MATMQRERKVKKKKKKIPKLKLYKINVGTQFES